VDLSACIATFDHPADRSNRHPLYNAAETKKTSGEPSIGPIGHCCLERNSIDSPGCLFPLEHPRFLHGGRFPAPSSKKSTVRPLHKTRACSSKSGSIIIEYRSMSMRRAL